MLKSVLHRTVNQGPSQVNLIKRDKKNTENINDQG